VWDWCGAGLRLRLLSLNSVVTTRCCVPGRGRARHIARTSLQLPLPPPSLALVLVPVTAVAQLLQHSRQEEQQDEEQSLPSVRI
jgi:hypothetical protein